MTGDDKTKGPVSRRRMLKQIGASSALIWSAPALTTVTAPAFAQQGSPLCRLLTAGLCGPGSPDLTCAEGGCPPLSPTCFCGRTLDGNCFCTSGGVCNAPGPPICQSDADCEAFVGPGTRCAELDPCTGNACSGRRVCVTPCAGGPAPRRAPGAPRREAFITVF